MPHTIRSLPAKPLLYALFAALLISGLVLTPARSQTYYCDETYVVKYGDTLTGISDTCDISIDDLMAANPLITDPNRIFIGMRLKITPRNPTPTPGIQAPTLQYVVQNGETFGEIAYHFHITPRELLDLNPDILDPRFIYPGELINLPSSALVPRVSLSKTRVKAGEYLEVSVSGFPANVDIDYRMGKQGQGFTQAFDGKTDHAGEASKYMYLPSAAKVGEHWIIVVMTTQFQNGVQVKSEPITIIQ